MMYWEYSRNEQFGRTPYRGSNASGAFLAGKNSLTFCNERRQRLSVYLLCQSHVLAEVHFSESLYRYCIEACSDGCNVLRSWRNSHMTMPQTSAAKIGYVCEGAGASSVVRFQYSLARPNMMREKR